jgi:transcriptional regulator with XRE-family HTH domain
MAAAERSAPPGVKSLRNRLGATQQELADLLQVAASSVHRWEAGRATPDRKTLARLGTLGRLLDLLDPHFRPEGRVEFFRTPQARLDGDRPMDLLGLPSAERRIERLIAALLAGDFS